MIKIGMDKSFGMEFIVLLLFLFKIYLKHFNPKNKTIFKKFMLNKRKNPKRIERTMDGKLGTFLHCFLEWINNSLMPV